MSTLSPDVARELVAALRRGTVPQTGLDKVATGLERLLEALREHLDAVAKGRGEVKFLRGEYGAGKTFVSRLICLLARQEGFATTEVVISVNDTPLHQFQTIYRRLVERLATLDAPQGAFKAVVDAWIYEVGEEVTRIRGLAEGDPAFDDAVEARLEEKLAEISAINPSFAQVLRGYHRATSAGDFATSNGLLGWLGGQPQVGRSVKADAGIKGDVDGPAALAFLRGLLLLLRQSGYRGLVLVLDEVETIQRMHGGVREKSLNALRQLVDMLDGGELPGLFLVVTGTREFYEGYKGLKGLTPLHQRIETRFGDDPHFDNLKAPQVRLLPFNRDRLVEVARKVRGVYPASAPQRIAGKVDDAFLDALVGTFAQRFGGVEITPRCFLRTLVDVLDRVDQHADYDPRADKGLKIENLKIEEAELNPEELDAVERTRKGDGAKDEADEPPPRRRLEG